MGTRRVAAFMGLLLMVVCWVMPAFALIGDGPDPLTKGDNVTESVQAPSSGTNTSLGQPGTASVHKNWFGVVLDKIKSGASVVGQAVSTAWDYTVDKAHEFGKLVVDTWDGLPPGVRGALKGIAVAVGVIGVVALAIVCLPVEIAAGVVAAIGGVGALVWGAIGALASGGIYGAMAGDKFNWGWGALISLAGGLGAAAIPRLIAVAPKVLAWGRALIGEGWRIITRGWIGNKGLSGLLTKGLKSLPMTMVILVGKDLLTNGHLESWDHYLKEAVASIVIGAVGSVLAEGFIATRSAKWLRSLAGLKIFGIRPFAVLNGYQETADKLRLTWWEQLRGKELKKALYEAKKPINTPLKTATFWLRKGIPKAIKQGKSYIAQLWALLRPTPKATHEPVVTKKDPVDRRRR